VTFLGLQHNNRGGRRVAPRYRGPTRLPGSPKHTLGLARSSPQGAASSVVTMSETAIACPECSSEYNYEQGDLLVCSMCAHEWNPATGGDEDAAPADDIVTDAFGTPLADGDTVTIIKDLKVKGAQSSIKVGTKVRGIRLVNGVGDHDIDCKVDGFGQMQLKSSVVKKV